MDGRYTVDVIKVDIGYWKFQLDIARNVRDIVVHGYWNLERIRFHVSDDIV